jgi:hypothetical protein
VLEIFGFDSACDRLLTADVDRGALVTRATELVLGLLTGAT